MLFAFSQHPFQRDLGQLGLGLVVPAPDIAVRAGEPHLPEVLGIARLAQQVLPEALAPFVDCDSVAGMVDDVILRRIGEESFRRLVSVVANPHQLLLLWLAWDIGENIDALLKLTKADFVAQTSRYSGEREYVVNLPAAKLKRSRQTRSEVTLYQETVRYADIILERLQQDDRVFPFEYRAASKALERAVRRSGATTMPSGQPVRWKDLRSGMACHLLRNGWTRDEVNARLGHTPHSSALDAYINFMALDRERPKQRMQMTAVASFQRPLGSDAQRWAPRQQSTVYNDQEAMASLREELDALRWEVQRLTDR